jgi:hypothetical protein
MAQKVQPQGLKSDGTLGTFRISDNNNLLVDFTPTSDDGLATAAKQDTIIDDLTDEAKGIVIKKITDTVEIDSVPNTIAGGVKTITTAGTAEALSATSAEYDYIYLQPLIANTGTAYIGGSDVDKDTKNGIALTVPSDSSGIKVPPLIPLPFKDPSLIYADVTVNGEGVHWIGIKYVAE